MAARVMAACTEAAGWAMGTMAVVAAMASLTAMK